MEREQQWMRSARVARAVVHRELTRGIYAHNIIDQHRPHGAPGRYALPVAGDDEAAKQVVRDLIDELGFDAIDTGGLDESWRQQQGTPVYGISGDVEDVRKALDAASPERTAAWRA